MLKRSVIFALFLIGLILAISGNAHAQIPVSALGYDGEDLTGYSMVYNPPYSEWEECDDWSTDGVGDAFCAIAYIYEPWVSVDAYLNGSPAGSDWELGNAAVVYYDIYHPPTGSYYVASLDAWGVSQYEVDCDWVTDCGPVYALGWWEAWDGWDNSGTVNIQHLTWASYSATPIYVPGCLGINADPGIASIDVQYLYNDNLQEADNYPNGRLSCVGVDNPYWFGTYQLVAAKSSADGVWALQTFALIVLPAGAISTAAVTTQPHSTEPCRHNRQRKHRRFSQHGGIHRRDARNATVDGDCRQRWTCGNPCQPQAQHSL
jgi:hypothetical protein